MPTFSLFFLVMILHAIVAFFRHPPVRISEATRRVRVCIEIKEEEEEGEEEEEEEEVGDKI
jgi:hypothetical protein